MQDLSKYQLFAISDMIHLEWTAILFVLVVFCLTLYFMNTLLFRPVLNAVESKKIIARNKVEQADSVIARLEEKQKEYEKRRLESLTALSQEREQLLRKVRIEAFDEVNEARAKSSRTIRDGEKALEDDAGRIKRETSSIVEPLKNLLVEQLKKN